MTDGLGDFTWTAAGAWGAFLTLLGLIVRQVGPWRKQSIDAEKSFRDDLLLRVQKLEDTLERERAIHNAERSIDRHRLNNVTQCLDAMLLMLEAAPEKAAEIVSKIKTMRSEQLGREAFEKASLHATIIEGGVAS